MNKYSRRFGSCKPQTSTNHEIKKNPIKCQFFKTEVPQSFLNRFEKTYSQNDDVFKIVRMFRESDLLVNINKNAKNELDQCALFSSQTKQEGEEYIDKYYKNLPEAERQLLKIERNVITKHFPDQKEAMLEKLKQHSSSPIKGKIVSDKVQFITNEMKRQKSYAAVNRISRASSSIHNKLLKPHRRLTVGNMCTRASESLSKCKRNLQMKTERNNAIEDLFLSKVGKSRIKEPCKSAMEMEGRFIKSKEKYQEITNTTALTRTEETSHELSKALSDKFKTMNAWIEALKI